ncbi:hypothetical protein N878_00445 [Pseudomonas sp. EGD-AK9]|nr:hypothetical protein N878_00445 [Pseudomonas sp. EGD-AK9]
MSRATDGLAFHDHRVNSLSAVLDNYVVDNINLARSRIDLNLNCVGAISEDSAIYWYFITFGHLKACDVLRTCREQMRLQIENMGNLFKGNVFVPNESSSFINLHTIRIDFT